MLSHRLRDRFNRWLPVIIWMILIFSASTDAMSERRTSRFIAPFLRWLKPDISDAALSEIQTMIRKGAHVTEYAILALLLWRARRNPADADKPRAWKWADAVWAVAICAAYAASDEFHQSFYPSRYASLQDVALDTAGAACGILLLRCFGRLRQRWSS